MSMEYFFWGTLLTFSNSELLIYNNNDNENFLDNFMKDKIIGLLLPKMGVRKQRH